MREGELDLSHGRLSDSCLAAVLMAARSREATGVLCIGATGGTSRLWLRRGVPAGAQMGFGFRPLGQILVLHGLVDLEVLDRAAPRLDLGEPLEKVLLDMGALDVAGLEEGRRLQLREHLRILCRLADGEFTFETQELPSWTEGLELDFSWSLAEALAAPPAEGLVLKLLTELGPRLLKLTDTFTKLAPLLRLSPQERQGLEAWHDGGTVEDLLKARVEPKRARWLTAALLALEGAAPVDPVAEAREQAERMARQAEEQLRLAAEEHARRVEEARAAAEARQREDGLRARLAAAEAARAEAARREAEEAAAAREREAQAEELLRQANEARAQATEQVRAIAAETRERVEEAERESRRLHEEALELAVQEPVAVVEVPIALDASTETPATGATHEPVVGVEAPPVADTTADVAAKAEAQLASGQAPAAVEVSEPAADSSVLEVEFGAPDIGFGDAAPVSLPETHDAPTASQEAAALESPPAAASLVEAAEAAPAAEPAPAIETVAIDLTPAAEPAPTAEPLSVEAPAAEEPVVAAALPVEAPPAAEAPAVAAALPVEAAPVIEAPAFTDAVSVDATPAAEAASTESDARESIPTIEAPALAEPAPEVAAALPADAAPVAEAPITEAPAATDAVPVDAAAPLGIPAVDEAVSLEATPTAGVPAVAEASAADALPASDASVLTGPLSFDTPMEAAVQQPVDLFTDAAPAAGASPLIEALSAETVPSAGIDAAAEAPPADAAPAVELRADEALPADAPLVAEAASGVAQTEPLPSGEGTPAPDAAPALADLPSQAAIELEATAVAEPASEPATTESAAIDLDLSAVVPPTEDAALPSAEAAPLLSEVQAPATDPAALADVPPEAPAALELAPVLPEPPQAVATLEGGIAQTAAVALAPAEPILAHAPLATAATSQQAVAEELMALLSARERAEEARQAKLREAHQRASHLQEAEGASAAPVETPAAPPVAPPAESSDERPATIDLALEARAEEPVPELQLDLASAIPAAEPSPTGSTALEGQDWGSSFEGQPPSSVSEAVPAAAPEPPIAAEAAAPAEPPAPSAAPASQFLDAAVALVEDMTIPDELGIEDLYGSNLMGTSSAAPAAGAPGPAPAAAEPARAAAVAPEASKPAARPVPSASPVSEYLDHAMALVEDMTIPDQLGIDDLFASGRAAGPASSAVGSGTRPEAQDAGAADKADIASAIESLSFEVPASTPEPTLDPSQFASPPEPVLDLSSPSEAESAPVSNAAAPDPLADIELAVDDEPAPAAPATVPAQEGMAWMQPPAEAAPPAPVPAQPQTIPTAARAAPHLDSASWSVPPAGPPGATPPREPELSSAGNEGEEMAETDDARARRQRLLQRAFNNLGSVAREQQSAHPPPPTARLAPPPPPPAVPAVPAAAPAPSVPGLAPEDEALAKAIAEKCALAAKKDYFALLGVSKSATKDQLKSAYLSLVKTFHPDRMPPSLGHLASQAKDVFSAIREAHETLQDENRRKAWLASQQAGPAPLSPANAEKAAEWAVQGDLALKKREYARAAEFFGRAFSVSKASSHLALQAWSVYLDPERKAELPQVKSKLEEALKLDARCDRACYCLGVIARVENDLDRAERLFKQAIESNPRNAEASTELRLLQMRRRKAKA